MRSLTCSTPPFHDLFHSGPFFKVPFLSTFSSSSSVYSSFPYFLLLFIIIHLFSLLICSFFLYPSFHLSPVSHPFRAHLVLLHHAFRFFFVRPPFLFLSVPFFLSPLHSSLLPCTLNLWVPPLPCHNHLLPPLLTPTTTSLFFSHFA